eukprot:11950615-Karenia_brevis.AAC.1
MEPMVSSPADTSPLAGRLVPGCRRGYGASADTLGIPDRLLSHDRRMGAPAEQCTGQRHVKEKYR